MGKPRARKLSFESRAEIKRRYAAGETLTALAKEFGVGAPAIQYHIRDVVRHFGRTQKPSDGIGQVQTAVNAAMDVLTAAGIVEWVPLTLEDFQDGYAGKSKPAFAKPKCVSLQWLNLVRARAVIDLVDAGWMRPDVANNMLAAQAPAKS